ncbi:5-hydroxytryptamine receptor 1A [Holothuria leucospilota]|uniref:5-hydroxytryptamine receptor 1A n=1 Tax=Holothuria leucospilota TaxID=206669 RepID=A0A9Q0YNJ0_HOLLE|nr:5-hydroxytryptamine receptor 1A [Holothuria leucospilota]
MENITGTSFNELLEEPKEVSSRPSHIYRVFLTLLITIMCAFGVIGNCLVAFAIARYPNLRTVTNYLIVSLAVADTTVCAWVMPIAAYQDLNGGMWRLGDILCDLWVGSDVLMSTASIWNLCAVSVDRYLAISRPIWYATKRKITFALILIFVAWSLSFMNSVMALLIVGGFQGNEDAEFCAVNTQPSFGVASFLVGFFIPACAILVLYTLILRSAMRLKSSVRPLHTDPDQPSHYVELSTRYTFTSKNETKRTVGFANSVYDERDVPTTVTTAGNNRQSSGSVKTVSFDVQASTMRYNEIPAPAASDQGPSQPSVTMEPTGGTNEEKRIKEKKKRVKISMTRERRAALVIGIVVLAFIACWLPFFSVFFMISVCTTCTVSLGIFQFVTWLGWCNSALNPIIYTVFNREFRQAFRKIFRRKDN